MAARAEGFLPVSLGPRILRTETATIVAAALVQGYLGDLG
jgi:16S rRNA (uracil1498-N3)-methyltransferase